MIYILRTAPSDSARELVAALAGHRLRNDRLGRVATNDYVICWGEAYRGPAAALNSAPIQNKLSDALKLAEVGIQTVVVRRDRPAAEPPQPPPIDPIIERWHNVAELVFDYPYDFPGRNPVVLEGLQQLERAVTSARDAYLNGPPPAVPVGPQVTWLGRSRNHVGGHDLLNPPNTPDFYVRKETLVAEYRVHSFLGASLRAGKKKPIEGGAPHAWIRSLLAGWKISYDGVSVRQSHRNIAHAAVEALGLDFGAVDIGEREDGSIIVLEVNRAPGLDGGTITAYADAIRKWVNGDPQ